MAEFKVYTQSKTDELLNGKLDVSTFNSNAAVSSGITADKVSTYDGYATSISNLETAVKSGVTFKGKLDSLPATDSYSNGDLIIVGTKEYILLETTSNETTTKAWIELGDEGSYLTKASADGYYVLKNSNITAGTHTKITYDSKGLVTGGSDLEATDIPSLAISKITGLQEALDAKANSSAVNGKQDTLSAGTNISITDNTVSTTSTPSFTSITLSGTVANDTDATTKKYVDEQITTSFNKLAASAITATENSGIITFTTSDSTTSS